MRRGLAAAGLALALCVPSAAAQDVSGTWEVTWAQAVRIEADGRPLIQKWGQARLTLRQDGNSVVGTWKADVADVTWRLTGTVEGGVLRLRATEHDSGDPELSMVEGMNWEGSLQAGRLEGRMWLVVRRAGREPVRRPWHGERRGGL